MKKTLYISTLFLALFIFAACNSKVEYDITTSIFPAYDIASNIGGNKLKVKMLARPGVEVHDYSPSSREIELVKHSKLFIFASYDLDFWLNNNESKILGSNTKSINLSNYINTHVTFNNDHEDHEEHDHLHFWTDPIIYINLIDTVLEEIIEIDITNKDYYEMNARNYQEKLLKSHNELTLISLDKNIQLFFAGHNALSPFSERYDIEINSLSNTNKPDADFSLNQIIALLEEIKTNNIHFLFKEELSEAKIAKTIKKELESKNHQLEILELHGYHNLTKQEFNNKVTYLDLLNRNIQNIKKAVNN